MTQFKIEGMHCTACERRITRALGKKQISVRSINHAQGTLDAELGTQSKDDVARIIAPLGYTIATTANRTHAASQSKLSRSTMNIELRILGNSVLALVIAFFAQLVLVGTMYQKIVGWAPQYAAPLLLLPVAIVANIAALWHQRAYRYDVSCMTGMMVGMTIGMTTGFTIGAISGLLNGMFWGSITALVVGMIAGAYAGACCGMMGTMEGLMAGFMGGTMGAMLTVMMIADHPVVFIAITIAIMIGILAGLSRIVVGEHEGRGAVITPWPLWAVAGASLAITAVLSAIMIALPHRLY